MFVTLPAPQKHFVNNFFVVAWEFCIEKGRDFRWIFSGLHFLGNKARKLLEKFGENSEQNSGGNSGQKFEKFGELSFCHFSDLNVWAVCAHRLKSAIRNFSIPERDSLLCLHSRELLWTFSSNLPGDLALKIGWILGVNFWWSPSPRK